MQRIVPCAFREVKVSKQLIGKRHNLVGHCQTPQSGNEGKSLFRISAVALSDLVFNN